MLYGGDECFLTPLPIDSIAYAYMTMTAALGFIPLRHEGKLTDWPPMPSRSWPTRSRRVFLSTRPGAFLRILTTIPRWKNSSTLLPKASDYVEAGGLMAYAVDLAELLSRMADDVHQILKGAKPGDIPIYQATKFELLINLKTAKTFGLTLPPTLLTQAAEIIE
jgi:hypothetical protein